MSLKRNCLAVIILTLVGVSMSCANYREYDPSPVGVFQPNGCVTVRGREANGILAKPDIYTICQPVKISAVGVATYPFESQNVGEHEVALLELSDGSIYVWTSTLREVGQIQYNGKETAASKTWRHAIGSLWKGGCCIGIIILLLLGLAARGGGGDVTWTGGGSTSSGGSWSGGGSINS